MSMTAAQTLLNDTAPRADNLVDWLRFRFKGEASFPAHQHVMTKLRELAVFEQNQFKC